MSARKKSFIDENNPALSFISKESIEAVDSADHAESTPAEEDASSPAPVTRRKRKRPEAKSRRVQVLMKPSRHEALKAIAAREGISVNEAINEAIEDYLANEV